MKTSELTGALLDYWVARAEGWEVAEGRRGKIWRDAEGAAKCMRDSWTPSNSWAQGGPIIEREDIVVERVKTAGDATLYFKARKYPQLETGDSYLIAAMRAYVASKFGDEVSDDVKP